jgi:hypothetical protein
MSMSDELKERNILRLILILRFACVALDVEHPIDYLLSIIDSRLYIYVIYYRVSHSSLATRFLIDIGEKEMSQLVVYG